MSVLVPGTFPTALATGVSVSERPALGKALAALKKTFAPVCGPTSRLKNARLPVDALQLPSASL